MLVVFPFIHLEAITINRGNTTCVQRPLSVPCAILLLCSFQEKHKVNLLLLNTIINECIFFKNAFGELEYTILDGTIISNILIHLPT